MRYTREVTVTKTYEVNIEDFVNYHLREIRPYEDVYDFYVSSNNGFISRCFSLKKSLFSSYDCDILDFEPSSCTEGYKTKYPENYEKHKKVCQVLIEVFNKNKKLVGEE